MSVPFASFLWKGKKKVKHIYLLELYCFCFTFIKIMILEKMKATKYFLDFLLSTPTRCTYVQVFYSPNPCFLAHKWCFQTVLMSHKRLCWLWMWTKWKCRANLSGPTKINIPAVLSYFIAHGVDCTSPDMINFMAKCGGISQPRVY
jgi:hypothetical protein